jgi:peptidoglycan/LPS O-acetylase OafA/YrhL
VRAGGARIPSLDGLRAISILLVLSDHLSVTVFPHVPAIAAGRLGTFGVHVFFVISGFLITSLLLDEESKTGTVSLRRFYLRRTLRIFPPYYAYLVVVALASAVGWLHLHHFDLLAAATYTTNYHQDRAWHLGHSWSLSVEEQFYLLWPFLMKHLGAARAPRAALIAIGAAPLVRMFILLAAPQWDDGVGETFPTVVDTLATGCLLACYHERLDRMPRLQRFLASPLFVVVPVMAVFAMSIRPGKVDYLLGQSFTNVCIALTIYRVVRFPQTWSGRLLNLRPVAFLGVISYSLYLWQQPFLNKRSHAFLTAFPQNVLLAVAVALLSYYVIERPALRLRARLESRLLGPKPGAPPAPATAPAPGAPFPPAGVAS